MSSFGTPKEIIKDIYEVSPEALDEIALWLEQRGLRMSSTNILNLGSYSTYTPTWTTTGVAPAIGNSTVFARTAHVGKMVHALGRITFGSTATFGTGIWAFSVPTPSHTGSAPWGMFDGVHASTGAYAVGVAETASANTFNPTYASTYLGAATNVSATTPWTWAAGDIFSWNVMYESA